ncbi:OsmC family protein [Nocardioides sp.]|uniref:OsmC family protein n=1 Tax=Nocardioides sp. TaxID=35761 RepID=UPI002ED88790
MSETSVIEPGGSRTPAPQTYRIHGRSVAGGDAHVEAATVTVPFDAGWNAPSKGLPGPAELLACSLAACLLKNLARAGALLSFDYDDAEVEVTARRQDTPPKFVEMTYVLRVTTDEPERRVKLLHSNLSRFGTIYNTLASACDVHGEVVATPRAAAGATEALDEKATPAVEMFCGSGCSKCAGLRRWLEELDIPLLVHDLTVDTEAAQRLASLGYATLPVLRTADGRTAAGADRDHLMTSLPQLADAVAAARSRRASG